MLEEIQVVEPWKLVRTNSLIFTLFMNPFSHISVAFAFSAYSEESQNLVISIVAKCYITIKLHKYAM
jgi:hypothetical protein